MSKNQNSEKDIRELRSQITVSSARTYQTRVSVEKCLVDDPQAYKSRIQKNTIKTQDFAHNLLSML